MLLTFQTKFWFKENKKFGKLIIKFDFCGIFCYQNLNLKIDFFLVYLFEI